MGLFVLTEGISSYNDDILLEAELTEEEFKNFDNMMNSNQAFNLDSDDEPKQTVKDTEKKVQDIEKKND